MLRREVPSAPTLMATNRCLSAHCYLPSILILPVKRFLRATSSLQCSLLSAVVPLPLRLTARPSRRHRAPVPCLRISAGLHPSDLASLPWPQLAVERGQTQALWGPSLWRPHRPSRPQALPSSFWVPTVTMTLLLLRSSILRRGRHRPPRGMRRNRLPPRAAACPARTSWLRSPLPRTCHLPSCRSLLPRGAAPRHAPWGRHLPGHLWGGRRVPPVQSAS